MPERRYVWCEPCQLGSYAASDTCSECGCAAQRLTKAYAEMRLLELELARKRRHRDGVAQDLRRRVCPTCGGPGVERQRFLSSGGTREVGVGNMAGQPRNVTGGSTVVVWACECFADGKGVKDLRNVQRPRPRL